jgi:hypothetical protein
MSLSSEHNSFLPTELLSPYIKNNDVYWCPNSNSDHHLWVDTWYKVTEKEQYFGKAWPKGRSDYTYGNTEPDPKKPADTNSRLLIEGTTGPRYASPANLMLATDYWGELAHMRDRAPNRGVAYKYGRVVGFAQVCYDGHAGMRKEENYVW